MEIRTIEPFLHYLGSVRERTMRVGRCIPPDKIDWSYAPGRFTLGDLLRHIAVAERYMWAENVQGRQSRYKQHGEELADSLENVLAFMERLHAESVEISPSSRTQTFSANAHRPAAPRLRYGNGCAL